MISGGFAAAILAGFAVIFAVLATLMLRGQRDLPPGYGAPGSGRADRRWWAGICVFLAVACSVFAVVSVFEG